MASTSGSSNRLAVVRPGRADHVADDVAAGRQRGQQGVVDAPHQRAQRSLAHDVELHALAGGQAHRAVGEVGDAVERQPLLGGEPAARDGGAHHAGVIERELGRRAGPADVTVVLLVDAVELEDDRCRRARRRRCRRPAPRPACRAGDALERLTSSTLTRKAPWGGRPPLAPVNQSRPSSSTLSEIPACRRSSVRSTTPSPWT